MKPDRFIIWLVQPLLAFLLIAAPAQAEPCPFEDESRVQAFVAVLDAIDTMSHTGEYAFPAILPTPDHNDDDHDSGSAPVLMPTVAQGAVDPSRLIEIGISAYPTAPPAHKPCAAPSTGPPLV